MANHGLIVACLVLWIISTQGEIVSNLKAMDREDENVHKLQTLSMLKTYFITRNVDLYIKSAETVLQNTDIWNLMLEATAIGDGTIANSNLTIYVDKVKDDFQALSDNVKVSGHNVHDILSKLPLPNLHKQISKRVQEVDLCNSYFVEFLTNPTLLRNVLNIVNCYDEFSYLETIAELLTNNIDDPSKNTLFGAIIKETGYCNGSDLLQVFHYFLGEYIQGCITMSVSEELKYTGSRHVTRQKCIATLNNAAKMRVNIFEVCREEPCKNIYDNVQNMAKNSDIGIFSNELQNVYPWFHFLVLRFIPDTDPKETLIGSTLNRVVINKDTLNGVQIILWSSKESTDERKDVKQYRYGIEFNSSTLLEVNNDMNMHKETLSASRGRAMYVGFVEYPDRFRCRNILTQDIIEQNTSWGLEKVSMARYGVIIMGVLLGVFVLFSVGVLIVFIVRRKQLTRTLFCDSDT